ncbi:hypothetical protein, partial [Streptomyces atriruber]|uniref:hypothetical protein n=1 Tax=Streptomyces atriruber TaxID=545121 RepID=UPI001ABFB7E1
MPEFELAELDYELRRESANVVDTPKGKGPPTATGNEFRTGNGTENGSGRVGNTKYRREAPGGKPERVSTKEA